MTLAQARLARLDEISRKDMGRVSGIFAQVRAARLGENTRFPICTHMQHSRNLAQSNHTLNYTVQALIQHSIMQFKVIRMISI